MLHKNKTDAFLPCEVTLQRTCEDIVVLTCTFMSLKSLQHFHLSVQTQQGEDCCHQYVVYLPSADSEPVKFPIREVKNDRAQKVPSPWY